MPTQTNPTDRDQQTVSFFLPAAMFASAIIFAIMGTVLPSWLEFPEPAGLILRVAFYAVAAVDIAIAFWLRARLKKAQRAARSGGTVQRQ